MRTSNGTALALIFLATFGTAKQSFSDQYPSTDFDGNLQLDYGRFDNNFLEQEPEGDRYAELRRLRLGLKSDFSKDWRAKLSIDASDGVELKDAYLKYNGWKFADITVGQQKEPFGLENLMGSKDIFMPERSMVTEALAPDRSLGLRASDSNKEIGWQLGAFHNAEDGTDKALTGRIFWAPWKTKNDNVMHIGTGFSLRDLDGSEFRINETLEVHSADTLIEGNKFNASSSQLNSLEFISQYHGIVGMAEWQQSNVSAVDNKEYTYEGGYVQFSYLLSRENRKYKNGLLGGVKSSNDWEITLRYSKFNLIEEESQGRALALGLNYYVNRDIEVMGNYIYGENTEAGIEQDDGNAVSLRFQYQF